MNFQEKLREASIELRAHAAAMADAALNATRSQTDGAAVRIAHLRKSLTVLNTARSEFRKIARRHAGRIVKQNGPLFAAVRKDVSELARSTYRTLTTGKTPQARRAHGTRKRTTKAA